MLIVIGALILICSVVGALAVVFLPRAAGGHHGPRRRIRLPHFRRLAALLLAFRSS
jgi:hypothetical protein